MRGVVAVVSSGRENMKFIQKLVCAAYESCTTHSCHCTWVKTPLIELWTFQITHLDNDFKTYQIAG